MKRPIDIDYVAQKGRDGPLAYVLLIVGAFALAKVGFDYFELSRSVDQATSRIERLNSVKTVTSADPLTADTHEAEFDEAHAVIDLFATPWPDLFEALEKTKTPAVQLLSIEPAPGSESVTLKGEAKDYYALLSYVSQLNSLTALRDVHLVHHDRKAKDRGERTEFILNAKWRQR